MLLKCSECGGNLQVDTSKSLAKCLFCGAAVTVSKNADKIGNLFNRATFLRQSQSFAEAMAAYEDLLRMDNTDAEAHWGLVLSKYGIEYVEDPATGERKPTCHRTLIRSILYDPDYLEAVRLFDPAASAEIQAKAQKIHDIQTQILNYSNKDTPFDIFICYKETDALDQRTQDSVDAQTIYDELTKRGYKVFFARKTLEEHKGELYEPIIFHALRTAKIMLLVGSRKEYFEAPWVKNEWSRFLEMSQESEKIILPVYRDISPYELPAELVGLQSQNMAALGYIQDITDFVDKRIKHNGPQPESSNRPGDNDTLMRLLKNGETFRKLDNYVKAEEIYTQVTNNYPESYEGWWGLILCKSHELKDLNADIRVLHNWFINAKIDAEGHPGFDSIRAQYIDYLARLASQLASEELRLVDKQLKDDENQLQTINHQRNELINTQSVLETDKQKEISIKDIHAKREKRIKVLYGLTIPCWIICVILALIGGSVSIRKTCFVIALVIGIPGFFIFPSLDPSGEKVMVDSSEVKIASIDRTILSNTNTLQTLEVEINKLQNRMEDERLYLTFDPKRVSNVIYSDLCKAIGYDVPCNQEDMEVRKKVVSLS